MIRKVLKNITAWNVVSVDVAAIHARQKYLWHRRSNLPEEAS